MEENLTIDIELSFNHTTSMELQTVKSYTSKIIVVNFTQKRYRLPGASFEGGWGAVAPPRKKKKRKKERKKKEKKEKKRKRKKEGNYE